MQFVLCDQKEKLLPSKVSVEFIWRAMLKNKPRLKKYATISEDTTKSSR